MVPHLIAFTGLAIILKVTVTYVLVAKNKEAVVKKLDWLSEQVVDSKMDREAKRRLMEQITRLKDRIPDDDFESTKKKIADELTGVTDAFEASIEKGIESLSSAFEGLFANANKNDDTDDK